MFPRVVRIKNASKKEVVLNFYTNNQAIEINNRLCVGCGICTKVCPKAAIKTPPTEGKIRISTLELIPEIPDALKCSYCGTCAYMCPFNAIVLKKDGKVVELKDLQIVKKKVVPILDYKLTYCENVLREVKVYLEGKIDVNWKQCTSCMNCVDVCPAGAFLMVDKSEYELVGENVILDERKCISCGTCVISCSKKAISLTIEKIKYSGDYKEMFWSEVVKKLK